ncbi:hypothetical protein ACP70R_037598 [Stipagrostis hirtigluma subsp. patula]
MLLSPRLRLSPVVRSPIIKARVSPSPSARREFGDFNLNEAPAGDFDLNVEPTGWDDGLGVLDADENVPNAQESARRKEVPDAKRRAIFEALVAKANKGNLQGHETTEVSEAFSVPLRTVQRIWRKGK